MVDVHRRQLLRLLPKLPVLHVRQGPRERDRDLRRRVHRGVDFKTEYLLPEELNRIDLHNSRFRKQKQVKIDWAKL